MPHMSSAQSNSIDPFGKSAESSKKLEVTFSIARGSTCQLRQRSSSPWNRVGSEVAEYPSDPDSKNADASASERKTDDEGNWSARRPRTNMPVAPSSLCREISKRSAVSWTANVAW
jgi:hypothetical protein